MSFYYFILIYILYFTQSKTASTIYTGTISDANYNIITSLFIILLRIISSIFFKYLAVQFIVIILYYFMLLAEKYQWLKTKLQNQKQSWNS